MEVWQPVVHGEEPGQEWPGPAGGKEDATSHGGAFSSLTAATHNTHTT